MTDIAPATAQTTFQKRGLLFKTSLDRVFELRGFIAAHGRFPQEGSSTLAEKALAKWLAKQRTNTNYALHRRLDQHVPTWRFAGRDGSWCITLTQVVWFVQENDRRPNKNAERGSHEAKLVAWVKNQQTALRAKLAGSKVRRSRRSSSASTSAAVQSSSELTFVALQLVRLGEPEAVDGDAAELGESNHAR